jgi:hypothetical protein
MTAFRAWFAWHKRHYPDSPIVSIRFRRFQWVPELPHTLRRLRRDVDSYPSSSSPQNKFANVEHHAWHTDTHKVHRSWVRTLPGTVKWRLKKTILPTPSVTAMFAVYVHNCPTSPWHLCLLPPIGWEFSP